MTDPREAKQRHEDALLSLPNVQAVCTARQITGGRETGQDAVVAIVSKKGTVSPSDRVPGELDGVPTDVMEAPLDWCLERPCKIGDAIGRADHGIRGTLGLVYVDPDDRVMLLTAAHVLMSSATDNPVGKDVSQPAGCRQMIEGRNRYSIGTVTEAVSPLAGLDVDAAAIADGKYDHHGILQREGSGAYLWTVIGGDSVNNFRNNGAAAYFRPVSYHTAAPGDRVFLHGATSGASSAAVYTNDMTVVTRLWGQPVRMSGLHGYTSDRNIIAGGDSGGLACVFWKGYPRATSTLIMGSGKLAVAVPIHRQLRALHPAMRTWWIGDVEPEEE